MKTDVYGGRLFFGRCPLIEGGVKRHLFKISDGF